MKFSAWVKLILQVNLELLLSGCSIFYAFIRLLFPKRPKNVRGKTIVITGAGHGFGRRLAIRFGALGAKVICVGRNHENTFNTAWEIRQQGGEAWPFECDVRRRDAVFNLASQISTQLGDVDILINMAGVYPVVPLLSTRQEEVLQIFETNTLGSLWMLQAFVPTMLETNSGHVVQMSSGAAVAPVAHEVAYSASKAAVTVMMDGLIEELRLRKECQVKITIIHPYYTSNRHDLPIRFELRFDRLSPDLVVDQIMLGILREEEWLSIPRYMWFFINLMRCIPNSARKRWRNIFYCRVWDLRGDPPNTIVPIDEPDKNLNMIMPNISKPQLKSEINVNEFQRNGIQKNIPEKIITEKATTEANGQTYILENSSLENINYGNSKKTLKENVLNEEMKNELNAIDKISDTDVSDYHLDPMPVPVRSGSDGRIVLHTGDSNSSENQDKENIISNTDEKEIDSGLKTIAYVDDDKIMKKYENLESIQKEEEKIKVDEDINIEKTLPEVDKQPTVSQDNEIENEFKICIQVGDEKINSLENQLIQEKDPTLNLTKM